eukprot:scaffold8264_cov372-Pinguiococcus_pyrenoidosus.AAC.3
MRWPSVAGAQPTHKPSSGYSSFTSRRVDDRRQQKRRGFSKGSSVQKSYTSDELEGWNVTGAKVG